MLISCVITPNQHKRCVMCVTLQNQKYNPDNAIKFIFCMITLFITLFPSLYDQRCTF